MPDQFHECIDGNGYKLSHSAKTETASLQSNEPIANAYSTVRWYEREVNRRVKIGNCAFGGTGDGCGEGPIFNDQGPTPKGFGAKSTQCGMRGFDLTTKNSKVAKIGSEVLEWWWDGGILKLWLKTASLFLKMLQRGKQEGDL